MPDAVISGAQNGYNRVREILVARIAPYRVY